MVGLLFVKLSIVGSFFPPNIMYLVKTLTLQNFYKAALSIGLQKIGGTDAISVTLDEYIGHSLGRMYRNQTGAGR